MTSTSTLPQDLFDGRKGGRAPFKAEYVSSLVSNILNAEIDQILRTKALQEQNPNRDVDNVISNLVEALKQERKTGKFPLNLFDTNKKYQPSDLKIGIIGGGIAGLYAAYILEFLNIDYEILEANPTRIGGRVYTHRFSKEGEGDLHDYYDIGAMRFPHSPVMARTFDLFRRLDMGVPGKPRDENTVLIPYYMTGRNCPTRYNDVTANVGRNEHRRYIDKDGHETQAPRDEGPSKGDDPFRVSTANGGTVPITRCSSTATDEILDDAYDRFRQKIKAAQALTELARANTTSKKEEKLREAAEARQRAYEYLMRHDKYSLREYLQNVEGYDPDTVHWLETIDSASCWYDMAFTENVLDSLAFAYDDAGNKEEEKNPCRWYCINGGTHVLIQRIVKKLNKDRIFMGKAVTKMALKEKDVDDVNRVEVTVKNYADGEEEKRSYSAVINTTTLGALQKIDLTGMELPYGMKTAIRVLRYDTSTKVGIRFKEKWWEQPEFDITLGGVAKTDLPIRVCVYPSYNIPKDPNDHIIGDDPKAPGVLLASYTWGQDSERIASHVSTDSPAHDKGLRELMEYNLARLHTVPRDGESKKDTEARFQKNKATIHNLWDTHHAYDWSKDEFSSGAFALFSPGQFSTLIPHLVRPASDARFVIVGEHASANHAWIVGALDSSFRGLKQILTRFKLEGELKRMIEEFEDVDELRQEQVAKQVIIATLTEEQMAELRLGRPVQAVAQVPQT